MTREEFERRWSGYAALFDYTPALEQAPQSTRMLAWMWPLVRPHVSLLLQALGLAVVVSVLQMVLPVFTQVIVDRVLVDQDLSLLHLLIVAMGATMCFIVVSLLLQRYLLSFSAVRIDAAALDFLTQRLLALPMSYFASRRTGDLQRRLEGIRQVRDFLVQHGIAGITAVAQLAATVALMAVYSPWLTLVFLATSPLYALLMIVAARVLRPVFHDLEDSYGRYHSYQIDAIKGIETVKALGGESAFRRLLLDQFLGVSQKIFKADFTAMSYEGAIDAVTFLGLGLFLWAGDVPGAGRPAVDRRPGRVQFARGPLHGADPQPAAALGQPAALRRAAQPAGRRVSARARAGARPLGAAAGANALGQRDAARRRLPLRRSRGARHPGGRHARRARRARSSPSSAAAARARRRSPGAWRASSSRPRARSSTTASI